MSRVLLVEDDPAIAESLRINFKVNGFTAVHAPSLKKAREALAKEKFDILLLDVNLPDGTGFDLCKEVREGGALMPILLLTAKTDEDSAVKGLSLGATDYIRKPFGMNELVMRMKRFLNQEVHGQKAITFGELSLHPVDYRVTWKGEVLTLTRREYDVLFVLLRRGGAPVPRADVLNAIDSEGEMFDGTLNSHISNLRTKIKKATGGELTIAAVYGIGYKIEKSNE